ncbi:MAG: GDP-mannose 4,6-dehydratase [Deltaproteobacteria bacterium]|nr:GDP-mannose 4,6-dehydratase [Deltaproteobacteria bacterium]
METTLISGGAGFIGSHLCDHFLNKGHTVICLDSLVTGNQKYIISKKNNKSFILIENDLTYMRLADFPQLHIDNILHFASPASPQDYMKYPFITLRAGSIGTEILLELAQKHSARFLLASTSEIYGDPTIHPQKEKYWGNVNPVGPRSIYDEAKRFAESYTMAYKRYLDLDIKIVRIFNTYGPRMRLNDGRALPNFMAQALKGKPITIYGDGTQTRSLCYITDLIDGIEGVIYTSYSDPINLGSPEEITILELAQRIKKISNSKSEIIFKPLPIDDPTKRCPEISIARKVLGWEPKVTLDEGLILSFSYFKQALSGEYS